MPSCLRYREDGKQKHLRTANLDVTNIFSVDKSWLRHPLRLSICHIPYVVSRKSNEFKNTIEIIQSAFEKNMASMENQFLTKIGTLETFRKISP